MLETVLRPTTDSGRTISTRGSLAVPDTSASVVSFTPGQMAPPMNSPRSDTTPKVVAVPKSMTMQGPP